MVCNGLFQIMPTGQVEATVQARRLTVQEGGLYNGQFRMITEDVAPVLEHAFAREDPISGGDDATPEGGRLPFDGAPDGHDPPGIDLISLEIPVQLGDCRGSLEHRRGP